jgi:hypothetical protein
MGGSCHDAGYHNAREACERINGTQRLGALAWGRQRGALFPPVYLGIID